MESPAPQLRLLLDHNFPQPVVDLSTVDATVAVLSLDAFDRTLTQKGTPDWLIYLRASEEGFDAVVTRDSSQLDDAEEMVALIDSGMNVVTWRHAIEDPIQEWGQLLAYMSLLKRHLSGQQARVILLPKPRLTKDQIVPARKRLYELAALEGTSFPEIRAEARKSMKDELRLRGREDLAGLLGPQ